MYENRVAGDSITVVKSPYYYDKKDVHLDKIVFKVENDAAAAAAALKAGDLQVLDQIDPTQLPGISSTSSLRIIKETGLGYQGYAQHRQQERPPEAAVHERRHADRIELEAARGLRDGDRPQDDEQGRLRRNGAARCTPISPSSACSTTSVKCTPYNPAEAKKLVQQSGVSYPTVHLMVPTATAGLRLAQFIQAEEAAVGINVIILSTDFVTSLSKADAGTYDMFQIGWSGRVDPDGNIYQFVATTRLAERQRLLEPAPRPDPQQRAQGVDRQGAKDAVQGGRADPDQRPAADLPVLPGVRAGVATSLKGVTMYPDTLLRVAFASFK